MASKTPVISSAAAQIQSRYAQDVMQASLARVSTRRSAFSEWYARPVSCPGCGAQAARVEPCEYCGRKPE